MDVESGLIRADDANLYYEATGAGDVVVLIHGFTLDTRMWDDQFLPFAERFRVIRYDLRGFGRSDTPTDKPYSHARDLKALFDQLEIEQAHLVGLSKGGVWRSTLRLCTHNRRRVWSSSIQFRGASNGQWRPMNAIGLSGRKRTLVASLLQNGHGWRTRFLRRHCATPPQLPA